MVRLVRSDGEPLPFRTKWSELTTWPDRLAQLAVEQLRQWDPSARSDRDGVESSTGSEQPEVLERISTTLTEVVVRATVQEQYELLRARVAVLQSRLGDRAVMLAGVHIRVDDVK